MTIEQAGLDEAIRMAARSVEHLIAEGSVAGAAIAADTGSGVRAELAVGDRIDGSRLRADDPFLLTSITKAITAIQILRLVEAGLLDLWTPVAEHLPDFVGEGKASVLVHHLLSHTSGLSQRANVVEGPPTTLAAEELADHALRTPLARPPGEVEYCSPAFWLLAGILRQCSGRDHVEDLVDLSRAAGIEPGHLAYRPEAEPPRRLVPAIASRNVHLAEQVRRVAYPAGGVVASAGALASLGGSMVRAAHGDHGVLSSATIRTMARPWSRGVWPDGRPAVWGLGMELHGPGDLLGSPTLFHAGASGVGFWVDLERGVALSVLTANWYLPRAALARVSNAFGAGLARGSAVGPADSTLSAPEEKAS